MKRTLLFLLLAAALPLSAQTNAVATRIATNAAVTPDIAWRAYTQALAELDLLTIDPAQRSSEFASPPTFTLEATKDDSDAVIRFGVPLAPAGSNNEFAVELRAPLNKKGNTQIATLGGLSGVPSVSLQWKYPSEAKKAEAMVTSALKTASSTDASASLARLRQSGSSVGPFGMLRTIAQVQSGWAPSVALTATGGRQSYDFADPTTFADASESRTSYSFGITGGAKYLPTHSYFGLSASYNRKYKEQDSVNRCSPVSGNTSVLKCDAVALGAPDRKSGTVVKFDYHQPITVHLGVNPVVARDLKQRVTTVSVPFYFIPEDATAQPDKIKLNGGVALDWDSKKHDVVISIFVGAFGNRPGA
jgi:hypothetical protein